MNPYYFQQNENPQEVANANLGILIFGSSYFIGMDFKFQRI